MTLILKGCASNEFVRILSNVSRYRHPRLAQRRTAFADRALLKGVIGTLALWPCPAFSPKALTQAGRMACPIWRSCPRILFGSASTSAKVPTSAYISTVNDFTRSRSNTRLEGEFNAHSAESPVPVKRVAAYARNVKSVCTMCSGFCRTGIGSAIRRGHQVEWLAPEAHNVRGRCLIAPIILARRLFCTAASSMSRKRAPR